MGSTFGGIEIGKKALQTQQKSLSVTAHNIANANNDKYSRQWAIQSTTTPYTYPSIYSTTGAGQVGTGVKVERIERIRDQFIDTRIRYENQALGEWTVKKDNLREIESIFNELDDGGLFNTLNEFWESFQELNNNPESLALRETVVQKSITLTTQFNNIDKALVNFREHLGSEIEGKIVEVNDLLTKIASLNHQIKVIESGMNKKANDLADERDYLIEKLSKMVDIQVRVDSYNQVNISLNGINLIDGGSYNELVAVKNIENISVNVDHDDNPLTADVPYQYDFAIFTFKVNGNTVPVESGEIKGLIDVRDKIIDYKVNKLDKLVRSLKNEVNYLHQGGYDLYGNTNLKFFEFEAGEYDAAHFKVNSAIASDPAKIAASTSPDPDDSGNGENALAIADLRYKQGTIDTTTFNDFWQTQASKLGIDIERAERMSDNQEVLIEQLKQKREEISGVSLDEELTEMIKYQHGYNAAAKVIASMNEMLDTLVNGLLR
ncbi:MAG: flagellar hook-associated protein 1 [Halanaerobiales bacterium]|nr:flagellar hook-associated protein 1 [Halanaerobiales bacterium]